MPNLLLLDAYSLIYRAFFAIRALNGPAGQPVNAIYGFVRMLRKFVAEHQPTHAAVVFDLGAPQHRLAVLPSYKEQRPPTPPDLDAQLPMIRAMLDALRVPVIEVEGEEADDIIATLAIQAARAGADVMIASNDKDFMQIVGTHICLLRPDAKGDVICGPDGVRTRYGVSPEQMVDFLSLLGDSVDNIRGVPGVGEKTAADLLRQFHTIDHLLAAAHTLPKPKLRDALLASGERLRTNRQLIALRCEVPLSRTWDSLTIQSPDAERLIPLLRQCGFKSLLAEFETQLPPPPPAQGDLFS